MDAIEAKYPKGATHEAQLHWFDASSGEGMIKVNGDSLYVHFSCIAGIDKNGYAFPKASDQILLSNLKPGDACKVTVYVNGYSARIETADFDLTSVAA